MTKILVVHAMSIAYRNVAKKKVFFPTGLANKLDSIYIPGK